MKQKKSRFCFVIQKLLLPLHSLKKSKGGYQSGQMGQTVNLLAMPSVVRIHHHPPHNAFKGASRAIVARLFLSPFCKSQTTK